MIYHFDTDHNPAATAALLVYATWCSRDRAKLKITPEIWGQVERFSKASAKRADSLQDFLERLKPRLQCATIQPRTLEVIVPEREERPFDVLTAIFETVDHRAVLDVLYRKTGWVVLLVRDRLERERMEAD